MRRTIGNGSFRPIATPAPPPWPRGAFLSALIIGGLLAPDILPDPAYGGPGARRPLNAHVPILSFGSVGGRFLPSGDHSGDNGGLPRRTALARNLAAHYGGLLHLDAGNISLPPGDPWSPWDCPDLVWAQMAATDVAATTPGRNDLADWPAYQRRIQSGLIPVVSSNLAFERDGRLETIGERFVVRNVNGVSVAIFGLIDRATVEEVPQPTVRLFHIEDPKEVAVKLVPKLRRQADVVVLLAQLDPTLLEDLVRSVPGIDVAIDGRMPAWVEEVTRIGSTLVQRTGIRGHYAGVLHLIVSPEGTILETSCDNASLGRLYPVDEETAARCHETLALRRAITDGDRRDDFTRRSTPGFHWRDPGTGWAPPPAARRNRRTEATGREGSQP